jgi:hypothetical protein
MGVYQKGKSGTSNTTSGRSVTGRWSARRGFNRTQNEKGSRVKTRNPLGALIKKNGRGDWT